MVNILGISAFYHDSAAALVVDGDIRAAAQEERFTRKKHDAGFPEHAMQYCLKEAGLAVDDLDYVIFYDKPFLKFERILETYVTFVPKGFRSFMKALPLWLKEKMWVHDLLQKRLGFHGELYYTEHHQSHAASAFYPSPYQQAAIVTMDGVGEWATASIAKGDGNRVELLKELSFPHSLGLIYSAFTYYIGFRVNSGEYKLMGLAPYGEPLYVDLIKDKLIHIREDGSFQLNMAYFNYCHGLTMTSKKFHRLFGMEPRKPESKIQQKHMDIARSIQAVTEEVMLKMAGHAHALTGYNNLVLAGGCALNCVGNGRILREGPFENVWIQPAAGDAGGALGAALFMWYHLLQNPRDPQGGRDLQKASLLGPRFSDQEIETFLEENNIPYQRLDDDALYPQVAGLLKDHKVVGWFQGRMEFGPRALGCRSILGDPRSPEMQRKINLKIKFRESFRPFAPSVLQERAGDYFTLDRESPYMLLVAPVKPSIRKSLSQEQEKLFGIQKLQVSRSTVPAITHVDYSARVQTVKEEDNPRYYRLIKAFEEQTGCGVVVNTSFNVRGEPIVCTYADAYKCFMRTHMDYLVLENFLIDKTQQAESQVPLDWQQEFEPD